MRTFWAFMAIVIALGVAAIAIPRLGSGSGGDQRAGVRLEEVPAPHQQSDAVPTESARAQSAEPARQDAEAPAAATTTDTSALEGDDLLKDLVEAINRSPSTLESTPVLADRGPPNPSSTDADGSVDSRPGATGAAEAEAPSVGKLKDHEIAPSTIRKEEDGSLTLDERFTLRGSGTKEDPYILNWELLVSASETFQPRLSKMRIPERIAMLDGKHVRVTAYIAFPILAATANEMLSMRNMWDGCCIGVPPTPYDAIEVRLKTAATGGDRFMSFGTVEGRFVVDPYVKGNWLLGLYMMEDSVLTQAKEAGL